MAKSRGAILGTLVGVGTAVAAGAALAVPEDFLVVTPGELPLILTAPHGGTAMAGLPARHGGVQSRDVHTLEVTLALAQRLHYVLGVPPYVVAAKFSRKAIDANRAADQAFDDPGAAPLYHAYHDAIVRFVAELDQRFPNGTLLIDIHGQATDALTVFRGTQDGATVRRLLGRAGAAALIGPDSILGALAAKGYAVFPANTPPDASPEHRAYKGGFTVQTYSRDGAGIDALQLELGTTLRTKPGFADDLADAIATFARAHLEVVPRR